MSAPAQEANPIPQDPPAAPALDTAAAEKLIGAWRKVYRLLKPLEAKVEAARGKVVKLLVDAGVESFASKFGKISLQRKATINWEQLARDHLAPQVIAGVLDTYKTLSAPFIRAPSGFAGEAK